MILIYASSNYSSLDDLTLYMDEYSKSPDTQMIKNTNLALKIMPGYNTARNALYMEQSTDVTYLNCLTLL